jgi:hypothetical protein
MMTRLILLALLLTSSPAHSQMSAVQKAKDAYEGCVELAALDVYVSKNPGLFNSELAERAFAACVTEENALVSVTALALMGDDRVLMAQAYVAKFRAALKTKLIRDVRSWDAK